MQDTPRLSLERVSLSYGVTPALIDVDLEVAAGEAVALVGPSGAGKSTLFGVVNLCLPPQQGDYRLDGVDTATLNGDALRRARTRIATIHQKSDIVGRLSVRDNVLAGRLGRWTMWQATRAWLWPRGTDVEEVRRMLDRVGIAEKLPIRADQLSGGQEQRVAIARALFQEAQTMLADEPIASVDPALAKDILHLLVETAATAGCTLLVNLHQPEMARRHFSRIVGLRDGRVDFDLPSSDVDDSRLSALFQGEEDLESDDDALPAAPQRPVDA